MKKESQLIIETIKKWPMEFKGIHVRYACEEPFGYNIVTVSPESMFNDKSFKKAVYDLWTAFENNFQSDLIVSEPDESYNMTNLLFDSAENNN